MKLYGSVGYFRDLEAVHARGDKSWLGPYVFVRDHAETQVYAARRDVITFVLDNLTMYSEACRTLRYSDEPLIADLAEELRERKSNLV